ncbi:MAG: hypothetical protein U0871_04465 [Gemmataceae bacterium]
MDARHEPPRATSVVEKRVFAEEKKTRHDLGREELVGQIWA